MEQITDLRKKQAEYRTLIDGVTEIMQADPLKDHSAIMAVGFAAQDKIEELENKAIAILSKPLA